MNNYHLYANYTEELLTQAKECIPLSQWHERKAHFLHVLNAFTEPKDEAYRIEMLIESARHGNKESMGILLALGTDPNATLNKVGAMEEAAAGGHKECIRLLKFYGGYTVWKNGKNGRKVFSARAIAEENGYKV